MSILGLRAQTDVGLVHGDISPSNVMYYYNMEGEVHGTLTDFDYHQPEVAQRHNLPEGKYRQFHI